MIGKLTVAVALVATCVSLPSEAAAGPKSVGGKLAGVSGMDLGSSR